MINFFLSFGDFINEFSLLTKGNFDVFLTLFILLLNNSFELLLKLRDIFLNLISGVFVVSSSHQDPLSQINELSQQLIQHQQNSLHNSKWFFSYVFTYYLLLHDVSSEDLSK